MVKITLLNCIVMSLFITAMTTYLFDDIVYLELVGFVFFCLVFLCVGIHITISIFYSKLCLLVSTQVHACVCVCAYIHCIHYAIYSDLHNIIISDFMYILHKILCYYY